MLPTHRISASRIVHAAKHFTTDNGIVRPTRTLGLNVGFEPPGVGTSVAPVLSICLAPLALVSFIFMHNMRTHYASLNLSPVLAGCWAIFAVWIELHKGLGSILLPVTRDTPRIVGKH